MTAQAQPISYMITGDRVSFVLNGRWRSYPVGSQIGKDIIALLKAEPQDIEALGEIADVQTWVARHSDGRVTVDECERLRLDGKLVDYGLTGRVSKIIEQGVSFGALARFIENVSENPNQDVAQDLYRFLEKGDIPFTPEGMITTFKRVDSNYFSFHSGREEVTVRHPDGREETVTGKVPHPVGGEIEMDRDLCDPNREKVCSVGLHACSFEYLRQYHGGSGKIVICLINPRDVTAIPSDADDTKLRCCRLRIVDEIPEADAREHFRAVVDTRYPVEPAAEDVEEIVEAVEEATAPLENGQRLKLHSVDDEPDVSDTLAGKLDPAGWASRGYRDGFEAGEADADNGYPYKPEFEVPPEIEDDELARAAYSKSFVESYDGGYRSTEAEAGPRIADDDDENP